MRLKICRDIEILAGLPARRLKGGETIMREFYLVCRCRYCGRMFEVKVDAEKMTDITPQQIMALYPHECSKDVTGVADVIAIKAKEVR